jgi:hypothetical protein
MRKYDNNQFIIASRAYFQHMRARMMMMMMLARMTIARSMRMRKTMRVAEMMMIVAHTIHAFSLKE